MDTLTATDFGAECLVAVYGTVRTGGPLQGWLAGRDSFDRLDGPLRRTVGMGRVNGLAMYEHPRRAPYPVVDWTTDGRCRVEVIAADAVEAEAFLSMERGAGYRPELVGVWLDDGRYVSAIVCLWDGPTGPRIPGDDWSAMDPRITDTAEHALVRAFDSTEQDPT